MILYIDSEKQIVFLYGEKQTLQIPFNNINTLNNHIKNQTIYYINQIVETTSQEVINLVKSINNEPIQQVEDDGRRWIHFNGNGPTVINDINLSLRGKFDIREFNDEMKNYIEKSPTLQKMIQKGSVVIINRQQRKKLLEEQSIIDKKRRENEDKRLDSMIVKDKAKNLQQKGVSDDTDDIEEIDLADEIRRIKN